MEVMEIEGKTIDEAIEKACSAFQVSREKLNIEIVSEGSSGFLGMGAKKALIRASLLSIDMMLDTPFTQPAVKPKTAIPARLRSHRDGSRQRSRKRHETVSEVQKTGGLLPRSCCTTGVQP